MKNQVRNLPEGEEAVEVKPAPEPVKKETKKVPSVVQVINESNRIIELDFGRDKELYFGPNEIKDVPVELLETPQFKHEEGTLKVYKYYS